MAEFKLVIGTKDGKCVQKEVKDAEAAGFLHKKIGETIKGESFGLQGYEFTITGGSDHCGFPMRQDVDGAGRKRLLAVKGIGIKKKRKGQRQRKTVCGNTIHAKISQINLKVLKEGNDPLTKKEEPKAEEAKAPKEEAKAEEKTAEEAPKEQPKAEEKTAEEPKEKSAESEKAE